MYFKLFDKSHPDVQFNSSINLNLLMFYFLLTMYLMCYSFSDAMETSETNWPVSSSEQSDSGDGDVPFDDSLDAVQDTLMKTNQSEQIDNKGNTFRFRITDQHTCRKKLQAKQTATLIS